MMSRLPEAQDDFHSATYYNYRTSNEAFQKKEYSVAYRYAMEFLENALKALLVKNNLYDDKPHWQGGDQHHSCEDLWDKIKHHNLINHSEVQTLDRLLPRLFKVDISSNVEHMDCASRQVTGFRYHDMDDFIDYDEAKDKVNLMNQVMKILNSYLQKHA